MHTTRDIQIGTLEKIPSVCLNMAGSGRKDQLFEKDGTGEKSLVELYFITQTGDTFEAFEEIARFKTFK